MRHWNADRDAKRIYALCAVLIKYTAAVALTRAQLALQVFDVMQPLCQLTSLCSKVWLY